MLQKIAELRDHYILCGAGRTGTHIIDRLIETELPFVVLEASETALGTVQAGAEEKGRQLLCIQGDATDEENLSQAGITQARGLIAALNDDKDNLFVVLTARALNPSVRIVSRVNDERMNRGKLERAGADRVISTDVIGGLRMASEIIRPEVVTFLDQMVHVSGKKALRFTELPLSEIKLPKLRQKIDESRRSDSALCINDIGRHTGLLVVAIKARDDKKDVSLSDRRETDHSRKRYRFTPRGDEKLLSNDILVVIGTQENLDAVQKP
jgi:voltage-gated potassium channel